MARRPVWRTLLLVALSLGFVAPGLWLAGVIGGTDFNDRPAGRLAGLSALTGAAPATVAAGAGWACVLVFGLFTAASIKRLFQNGPALRINAAGIWSQDWSDRMIPWDQVRNPRIVTVQHQRFVTFDLRDRLRHRSTTIAGRLAGVNRAFGYGDVSLGVTGMDRRFEEMQAAFLACYQAAADPAGGIR